MPGRAGERSRGKLTAVASRWASGRGGKPADDPVTQAALAARGKRATDEIELTAEDGDIVRLFFALGSQWRVHPLAGVRTGIDYAAVPATAAMMGMAMTPDVFEDLRTMEGAALSVWAKR